MTDILSDFVGAFVGEVSQSVDADLEFIEMTALTLVSTFMGRSYSVPFGLDEFYPNIWCLLVGMSSDARKSTCVNFASNVTLAANSDRLYTDDTSPEAFFDQLRDAPEGAIMRPEFIRVIDSFKRDYMGTFQSSLMDIYDNVASISRRRTKKHARRQKEVDAVLAPPDGGREVVVAPYLCMFGGMTPEIIEESTRRSDVTGGFYPRFMFCRHRRSRPEVLDARPIPKDFANKVVEFLHNVELACNYIRLNPQGEDGTLRGRYEIPQEVSALFRQTVDGWKAKYSDAPPFFVPFITRHGTYLYKIALIYSFLAGQKDPLGHKKILTVGAMERSIRIVSYSLSCAVYIFEHSMARSREEREMGRLFRFIESKAPESVSRRDILRSTGVLLKRTEDLVSTLMSQGRIVREIKEGHGRESVWYRLATNGEVKHGAGLNGNAGASEQPRGAFIEADSGDAGF